jgi:hypothetical protein
MNSKFCPPALGPSLLLATALAGASTTVGSSGSIQAAIDACPAAGCEIVLTDPEYALSRELWIEGKSNLVLRRSDAMAQQGTRPKVHLASGIVPFDLAGTSANPTDPMRPAGWRRWPISSKDTVGGVLDSTNLWSTRGFQLNGLVVVYRSRDVRLEGLEIDGGGISAFQNMGIWNGMYDIVHGNVGVNLFQSLRAQVVGCDIHGFFSDLYINDRNTTGLFADTGALERAWGARDSLGSGSAGDHIVERDLLHDSHWAVYHESGWDLGSDFRFNRAWNLATDPLVVANPNTSEAGNQTGGFFYLKDVVGPVHRIHNNTVAGGRILLGWGGWNADVQHLVYNNYWITDRSRSAAGIGASDWRQLLQNSARWFWNNTFELGDSDSLYAIGSVKLGSSADSAVCFEADQLAPCGLVLDSSISVRSGIRGALNGWTVGAGATRTGSFKGHPIQFFQSDDIELFPGGGRFSQFPRGVNKYVDGTDRNAFWVVQAPLASRDPASAQHLVPVWDSGSAAAALTGQGWRFSGWQASNGTGNPDIGAMQRYGWPARILRLESQRSLVVSGNRIAVPLVFPDKNFWTGIRIESVDAWCDGVSSISGVDISSIARLPIHLETDSTGVQDGQNLIIRVDSSFASGTYLRVHVVVSAWSDSLGGRRISELAYFRTWAGQGGKSSIRSFARGPGLFQARRIGETLRATVPAVGTAQVEIFRPDGQRMLRQELTLSDRNLVIPIAGLPRGTWILRVEAGGKAFQQVVPGI